MSRNWMKILLAGAAAGAITAVVSVLLAPLVFALVVITLSPFARPKRLWFVGDVESEFRIVSRRREEALRALKDLEDDLLAGKASREESEQMRPALLQTAKDLTAQLDALQQRRAEARKKIEAELARAAGTRAE
jgi:hypothetical protein